MFFFCYRFDECGILFFELFYDVGSLDIYIKGCRKLRYFFIEFSFKFY